MEVVVLIGAGVALTLTGISLGRYVCPATRGRPAAALVSAQLEAARLGERFDGLTRQAEEQAAALRALENRREAAAVEAARLKERETALMQKISEQATELASVQDRLTTEFENIANRILRANATKLSESSQKALAMMLDPLRERIEDFRQRVEATYEAETREVLSLKEQIKLVTETSQAVGAKADGLAQALRGDSQLLGRWGELALERILEAAGLTAGREYVSQGRGLGLRSEAGGAQRPDVVIMLPEGRTMIIDSKVPLAGYERLIAVREDAERLACGERFVRDVKGHIDGLPGSATSRTKSCWRMIAC